jgi:hypothetical protein
VNPSIQSIPFCIVILRSAFSSLTERLIIFTRDDWEGYVQVFQHAQLFSLKTHTWQKCYICSSLPWKTGNLDMSLCQAQTGLIEFSLIGLHLCGHTVRLGYITLTKSFTAYLPNNPNPHEIPVRADPPNELHEILIIYKLLFLYHSLVYILGWHPVDFYYIL